MQLRTVLWAAPILTCNAACGPAEGELDTRPILRVLELQETLARHDDRILWESVDPPLEDGAMVAVAHAAQEYLEWTVAFDRGPARIALERFTGSPPESDAPQDAAGTRLFGRARPGRIESLTGESGGTLVSRLQGMGKGAGDSYVLYGIEAPEGSVRWARLERKPKHANRNHSDLLGGAPERSERVPSVGRINLAGDFRTALLLPCGTSWELDLSLPSGASHLEWAVGALETLDAKDLAPVRYNVSVTPLDGAGQEPLSSGGFLNPAARLADNFWLPLRLQVAELAGQRVRLSFTAGGQERHSVAFAHPRVVRAKPPEERPPNLILVSIDTLRADRLGCLGGSPETTPNLDALAERGALFENCQSTAPYTLPSHGSMLSGVPPTIHGAIDNHDTLRLGSSRPIPWLADTLKRAGWTTAAFTGGGYLAPDYGFSEGFDQYSTNDPMLAEGQLNDRPPPETTPSDTPPKAWAGYLRNEAAWRTRTETVTDWIEQHRDRPFFLFLHTFATHEYTPPPDDYEAVCGDRCGCDWGSGAQLARKRSPTYWKSNPFSESEARHVAHVYDATVRHTDRELGRVLATLDTLGLRERTLVIVTSDHGEEFFEHGVFGHSRSLHQTLLHVPLIVAGPGVTTGRVSEPVSLIDIAPTALSLLGLPADQRMTGRVLPSPGEAASETLVLSHVATAIAAGEAARMGDWKLIRTHLRSERSQLFDLGNDPGELRDLASEKAEVHAALTEAMETRRERQAQIAASLDAADAPILSQDTLDELKALGYLGDEY